jgi:hypothetical protein
MEDLYMKKLKMLFVTLIAFAFIAPMVVKADDVTYTNLNDTLTAESITTNSDYQESDSQATIYLFRGHGCSHCAELLQFLADLSKTEYGSYFKLRAYEVWYNTANSSLMSSVATSLNTTASGVPFFVIGSKYFSGYSSSMDDDIKTAIKAEYDAATKTDVVANVNNGNSGTASTTDSTTKTSTTNFKAEGGALIAVAVIAAFIIYLVDARKKNTPVEHLKAAAQETTEEVKKEVKKAKKTTKKSKK